ncbi:MAG: acyltransferase family protein [Xanthobacteraceae bacterium]
MIHLRSKTGVSSALSDWLDLVRGLAAIEVVLFHSYQLLFQEQLPAESYGSAIVYAYSVLWSLSAQGPSAVIVFFVLSGYLVGGPALVRASMGRLNGVDYLSARAARLYVVLIPALVLSLLFFVSARYASGWQVFVNAHRHLEQGFMIFTASYGPATASCNMLFLQTISCSMFAGNMALWSLSNEFWYYLLIFAFLSVRRSSLWGLLIVVIFFLFAFAEHSDKLGYHTGLKFFFYFLIWSLGTVIYAISVPILLWSVLFVAGVVGTAIVAHAGLLAPWAAKDLIIGLVTAAAIVGMEFRNVELPSFLRFGKETAKWSFSLYAIHYPMLVFLNVMSDNPHDFTIGSIGLDLTFTVPCLLLAVAFYFLFERHTDAVRMWIKHMWTKHVAVQHSSELLTDNWKLSAGGGSQTNTRS